jgi:hypothetical protein
MTGSVIQIFVAEKSADVPTPVGAATLQAGSGLLAIDILTRTSTLRLPWFARIRLHK